MFADEGTLIEFVEIGSIAVFRIGLLASRFVDLLKFLGCGLREVGELAS